MSDINYRKDIDGLRALAIIPVLLFHSGFSAFSGGYIGVDVFFAISGFLITSIILKQINNDVFSFKKFFLRRVRRLLPLAVTVYLVTLIVFAIYFPVTYYKSAAEAAFASLAFFSNIYFWQQGGYFSTTLELNPLLHTWSLSVEEQFYLTFPFLLYAMLKIIKYRPLQYFLMLIGIIFSIVLAIHYAPTFHSFAAFYLLPSRFYELALGAFLALYISSNPSSKLRETPLLKEIGVLLIVIPVFLFDENTTFPSYNALYPVMGAVLVMFSNRERGLVHYLLTSKYVVIIGLISYSLYLWHWPLIVLKNWFAGEDSAIALDIAILIFSIIVSMASYKYIEVPFRDRKTVSDKRLIKTISLSFTCVMAFSVYGVVYGNALIVDPDGKINKIYNAAVQPEPYREKCTDINRHSTDFEVCELPRKESTSTEKRIFVWGDSHGSALMPALDSISKKYVVRFSNTTGCPPALGIKRVDFPQSCVRVNNAVFDHLEKEKYDLVVLAAAFNNYLNRGLLGEINATHFKDTEETKEAFDAAFIKTLENIEELGSSVLIITQPPRFNENVPDNYVRNTTLGIPYDGETITLAEYDEQREALISIVKGKWKADTVSFDNIYCPENTCVSMVGSHILYKDSHHISNYLASILESKLFDLIDKRLSSERD